MPHPTVLCRGGTWRHLYGHFNVWLDVEPDQQESEAPQRGAYADAEVHVAVQRPQQGAAGAQAAQDIVAQVGNVLL